MYEKELENKMSISRVRVYEKELIAFEGLNRVALKEIEYVLRVNFLIDPNNKLIVKSRPIIIK